MNWKYAIYPGADGDFTLYEDENDNYNYEKGVYSTITFTWNDAKNTLTISDRQGSFQGMITERKFNIIRVPTVINTDITYSKTVTYKGEKVMVKF